jgi:hypothetical protein
VDEEDSEIADQVDEEYEIGCQVDEEGGEIAYQ